MENTPETFEIEEFELRTHAECEKSAPNARTFHVHIDDKRVTVDGAVHNRVFLLGLVGRNQEEYELIEEFVDAGDNEVVERGEKVDLRTPGLRGFITASKHHHQRPARISIDDVPYKIPTGPTLGSVLRDLPKPPVPADRDLWLEKKGDDEKVLPTTIIKIVDHMCFYTAPSTINPGEGGRNDAPSR
jgi:hypothetical protein